MPYASGSSFSSDPKGLPSLDAAACRWDNCNGNVLPPSLTRDSTVDSEVEIKEILTQHVHNEHLRVPLQGKSSGSNPTPQRSPAGLPFPYSPISQDGELSSIPDDEEMPIHPSESEVSHACKWQNCPMAGATFQSSVELTQHITKSHVGAGQSRYHCLWEGCNRNQESGFLSKQKILRHIQSHTGEFHDVKLHDHKAERCWKVIAHTNVKNVTNSFRRQRHFNST